MSNTAEIYHFTDDGVIPNNRFPVVIYRKVIEFEPEHAADWLEDRFEANGWTNPFRWRVYDYHHYHSNTHEVLVYIPARQSFNWVGKMDNSYR